ncbi:MAG TPA: type I DNA topoisomerase [Candidatus Tidjanibacter faecipullorum]|uniref:DNA topoisomerase 1 n=1 Tax=Candidatus Tidjanibacter faecipullorum TaxID=2838766 RepID=A0A9D2IKV1_9BACT|nr:type I DNA topoisomerase [Candidatus Tidjanibacter faecipullorum]
MHENLVIVESPAKAKTIEKFLGKDYTVMSSYGHIRDLSKKELGIDLKDNFKPDYEISPDKKKLVESLAKSAQESKTVWLASDEDREGEAIAWHLTQVLGLPVDQTKRIVFHEITKNAILEAIEHPRTIDMNLVNAQQARRLLDRLVGFELSPVLWKKVKPSLSAGRVQSVAVRLIVEREREIINFRSVSYYRITARFYRTDDPEKTLFRAELDRRFDTAAEAEAFLQTCSSSAFTVLGSESKPAERNPAGPFTTSTLQQEAGRKLGMSVSQTMTIAQRLYENGYITYMRTDSQNLSSQAIAAAHDEIVKLFGENYSRVRKYKTKSKGAQEAHEAIRPSYLNRREIEGSAEEKKLYDLIWKRTVASQMSSAKIEKTVVTIGADNTPQRFIATGEVVLFDGFMKLYSETVEDETEEGQENRLPELRAGDALSYQDIAATERFTQPPFRYSEASLVRKLEELGIGRPSTYAPTISTIINRGYVIKQNRPGTKRAYNQIKLEKGKITSRELSETVGREKAKLSPTDIGMIVTDYLDTHFEKILDYNFTANVEKEFDEIAEGEKEWTQMLHDFYAGFHPTVEKALEEQVDRSNKSRVLGIDPQSGHQVSARIGRYGPIVQIDGAEGEKPRYASLKKDQLIATITLEEALDLFKLPRTLGELEGKEVVVSTGRYGPYIRYDGKFTSLPRKEDPYSITLERAIELIHEKESADKAAKEPIKLFPEDTELKVLNGRYGPYIAYKGKNYRIPKGSDPAALTYEEACKIMETSKKKK